MPGREWLPGGSAFQAESTSSQRSTGARQKLALPCPRLAHDGLQVVEMRLPFEQRTGMVGSRHDLCRVPGPSAGGCALEIDAGGSLYRLDRFERAQTPTVVAIECDRHARAAQIRRRVAMRAQDRTPECNL